MKKIQHHHHHFIFSRFFFPVFCFFAAGLLFVITMATPLRGSALKEFEALLEKQGSCVATFQHWKLYLDRKQYYLGRCFAWAMREDCDDFDSMTNEEYLEFKSVAHVYRCAMQLEGLGRAPDMINISFLGNEMTHCHAHLVPRYKEAPIFENRDWTDEQWGGNWGHPRAHQRNTIDFNSSEDTALYYTIRDRVRDAIQKVRREDRA